MAVPLHPDLLPEPPDPFAPDPYAPAEPAQIPMDSGCTCTCVGHFLPAAGLMSCGCQPCPAPAGGPDLKCAQCREWAEAGRDSAHHGGLITRDQLRDYLAAVRAAEASPEEAPAAPARAIAEAATFAAGGELAARIASRYLDEPYNFGCRC